MKFDIAKRFTVTNFAKYTAPILRQYFDAAEIHDTELLNDAKFKSLDRHNGVDGYVLRRDGTLEYFASRVQQGFYPTFSVRKSRDSGAPAEFTRLCRLIEDGQIYPRWFIQTYIQDDKVTVAIIRTKDLINFIKKTDPPAKHTNFKQSGQSEFYICEWSKLQNFGCDVHIFEKSK